MIFLLKNARVIDPSLNIDETGDILIKEGKIMDIGSNLQKNVHTGKQSIRILDLTGYIAVPGLIDMHTHLREPGFEYKETIATGSAAAAAGGFTSIACMPNTQPVNDNRSVTEFILSKGMACGLTHIYPVAAITCGSEGKNLTDFWDLKEAGAVALSDDGKPLLDSALMRRALEYADSLNLPVISHCEDTRLSIGGQMNEDFVATELGFRGTPTAAEEIMVARETILTEFTRTSVHIAHVSTAGSVRLIREAKNRGIRITAETAPHYFALDDEILRSFDPFTKVNPPLRTAEDVASIRQGLRDGTIDAIASDHAPHAVTDKEVEFEYAASGMIGLETSLGLSLKLIDDGILTWSDLVRRMSVEPARILRIAKGTLQPGADADVTVIDPEMIWTINRNTFRSKSRNTPFHGWTLKGKAILTIVQGTVVYQDAGFPGSHHAGASKHGKEHAV
ncbi:MAG: dihydroorotase [Syntrophales bacterium]|jgi:dihydroorotase